MADDGVGLGGAVPGNGLSGLLDREAVGDVNTELSGGHKFHRTPQVASDERRIHLTEGSEVEADDADAQ